MLAQQFLSESGAESDVDLLPWCKDRLSKHENWGTGRNSDAMLRRRDETEVGRMKNLIVLVCENLTKSTKLDY